MAKVSNAIEILPKIWTAWVRCTSVTDDRQTDGRAIAYSEREHEFTFAKNHGYANRRLRRKNSRFISLSTNVVFSTFSQRDTSITVSRVCSAYAVETEAAFDRPTNVLATDKWSDEPTYTRERTHLCPSPGDSHKRASLYETAGNSAVNKFSTKSFVHLQIWRHCDVTIRDTWALIRNLIRAAFGRCEALSRGILQILYLTVDKYTVSQKTSHLWFAITLTYMNSFWYFFGRNVTDKVSNQIRFTVPPQITCASALPWKTEKHGNHIFHSNAVSVHCENSTSRSLISSVFLTHDSFSRCCMSP